MNQVAHALATRLTAAYDKLSKAEDDPATQLIDAITQGADWLVLEQLLTPELQRQFVQSGYSLITALRLLGDEELVTHMDPLALEYAQERASELVGMRRVLGENGDVTYITNPNPEWSIGDSTRELLRGTVADAIKEGWSADKLAGEIADSYAFSDARAEMIARTELAFAHVAAHLEVGDQTGATGKRSLLGSEHDHDVPDGDECDDAEEAGVIALDAEFVPGYDAPPYHPNCVCDVELTWDEAPDEGT